MGGIVNIPDISYSRVIVSRASEHSRFEYVSGVGNGGIIRPMLGPHWVESVETAGSLG